MHPEKQNLKQIQALLLALVVLAFPFCAWLVYQQNQPRLEMANMLACVYGFGLYAVFFSPWLPIPGRKLVSPSQRLQESVIIWFWVTYITHLTWEFGWLVFHDAIVNGKDASWTYIWWAYIDGGDYRYAEFGSTLVGMEILSVINGIVGMLGLFFWYKKPCKQNLAILLFMATAVVHLYATSLYYLTEILEGFPNVNTESIFDIGVKFIIANSPWLVMPCLVLKWGGKTLTEEPSGSLAQ
ncbi:MAG: hypothetical protein KDI30_07390 [Pseudomonadales bacterium]|nr:hypothetical protein [Pseudomonadales bacterium]